MVLRILEQELALLALNQHQPRRMETEGDGGRLLGAMENNLMTMVPAGMLIVLIRAGVC